MSREDERGALRVAATAEHVYRKSRNAFLLRALGIAHVQIQVNIKVVITMWPTRSALSIWADTASADGQVVTTK